LTVLWIKILIIFLSYSASAQLPSALAAPAYIGLHKEVHHLGHLAGKGLASLLELSNLLLIVGHYRHHDLGQLLSGHQSSGISRWFAETVGRLSVKVLLGTLSLFSRAASIMWVLGSRGSSHILLRRKLIVDDLNVFILLLG
jgi:hypothetical protein